MFRDEHGVVSSATDLVNHLACEHLTQLERTHLDTPLDGSADPDDPNLKLLQRLGQAFERGYLERLRAVHPDVVEISPALNRREAAAATLRAMQAGASLIYQATFRTNGWYSKADFLRRVERPSQLGAWSYEAIDTKLALRPKPEYLVQLCVYSWLLAQIQGVEPTHMVVATRKGPEVRYRVADYAYYFARQRARYLHALDTRPATYPHANPKCKQCRWSSRCDAQRAADDHLSGVASITREQISRLTKAGIGTLTALGTLDAPPADLRMARATFDKLRTQAAVHLVGRRTGAPYWQHRTDVRPGSGFERLPPPSEGDLYFDMEGDPHVEDGGLEYLFGVTYRQRGDLTFRPFWGHDRLGEKHAFEAFIDFVVARIERYPDLHIYHYSSYERAALERLMTRHGTREAEVDALFRDRRLVDLYRVVLEGVVASTESYSIKYIEALYRAKRDTSVKTAADSVIKYEEYRSTGDVSILAGIELYNRDDCDSTEQLHRWLIDRRPDGHAWRDVGKAEAPPKPAKAVDGAKAAAADEKALQREEQRRAREATHQALIASVPPLASVTSLEEEVRHTTADLMQFHAREAKPGWWAFYELREADLTTQLESPDTLIDLTYVRDDPKPTPKSRPLAVYTFPPQDTRLRADKRYLRFDTMTEIEIKALDLSAREVKFTSSAAGMPTHFSLGPAKPFMKDEVPNAIARYAAAEASGSNPYVAVRRFLHREPPVVSGIAPGAPLVPRSPPPEDDVLHVVRSLQNSYLYLQGPPGAGKTFTGSYVIARLLEAGHTVAISSLSHKSITTMVAAVEEQAARLKIRFKGLQVVDDGDPRAADWSCVEQTTDAALAVASDARLIAGTAWLLSRPGFDQRFDFLFLDEAGQIATANLVGTGTCARNLVLLGDQMQLGQPTQAKHPGRAGDSVLEYLLDGASVIAPDRGIFLAQTYRMHPDVCRFISEAVYQGQLKAEPACGTQQLLLTPGANPTLVASGIRFHAVEHEGNTQASDAEAEAIADLCDDLLKSRWRNKHGVEADITPADIIVLSPYNLQVETLRRRLPAGIRLGSVDLLQGQEAPVVLYSLASSGEEIFRSAEFLYSKNRLNVALSRARCLAIVVACPRLLDIACTTIDQMALVNTFCRLEAYGRSGLVESQA